MTELSRNSGRKIKMIIKSRNRYKSPKPKLIKLKKPASTTYITLI
jgi:hypothetical protein